jgi:hypothetical protein
MGRALFGDETLIVCETIGCLLVFNFEFTFFKVIACCWGNSVKNVLEVVGSPLEKF